MNKTLRKVGCWHAAAPVFFALAIVVLLMGAVMAIGVAICVKLRSGKKLNDPVLGPITYDGFDSWTVDHAWDIPALGGKFKVAVMAPRATGPSMRQRQLLPGLIERQGDLHRQLELSLFREYQEIATQAREDLETDQTDAVFDEESLPFLREPAEIWRSLTNGSIFIGDPSNEFTIRWDCTWGLEIGVVRRIVNWMVDEAAR